MQQAIKIVTSNNVVLDMYDNTTIELNMGGISLLTLESRTATYTNSFNIPRTPKNEKIFSFCSQYSSTSRPSINAKLILGTIVTDCVITALTYSKSSYSCSLSIGNITANTLKSTLDFDVNPNPFNTDSDLNSSIKYAYGYMDYLGDIPIELTKLFAFDGTNSERYAPMFYYHESGNCGMYLYNMLELIRLKFGIKFKGTLLSDSYFIKSFVVLPNYGFKLQYGSGLWNWYEQKFYDRPKVFISTLLKAICQVFFVDMNIEGNVITLNKVVDIVENDAVELNNNINIQKNFTVDLGSINYILYNNEGSDKYFGSDSFSSIGVEEKTIFTSESFIPNTESGLYVVNSDSVKDKVIIFYDDGLNMGGSHIVYDNTGVQHTEPHGAGYNYYCPSAQVLSMSGYYSGLLNSVFNNPVIIECNTVIDVIKSKNIMSKRIIKSSQLHGIYWVETMAYNIQTGSCKLKLIKLKQ